MKNRCKHSIQRQLTAPQPGWSRGVLWCHDCGAVQVVAINGVCTSKWVSPRIATFDPGESLLRLMARAKKRK